LHDRGTDDDDDPVEEAWQSDINIPFFRIIKEKAKRH